MNAEEMTESNEVTNALAERAKQWAKTLRADAAARDRFSQTGRTVDVKLKPYDAATAEESVLAEQVRDFVEKLAKNLVDTEGVYTANAIKVEAESGKKPVCFYGRAYILSPGVPEPPD
jgi:hypothetical protein